MKRYTVQWAMAPKQVRMTRATKPKPFPGKYPTRIAWKGTLIDGKPSTYIGKPTRKAVMKFYSLLRGCQFREVCIVEFDRAGVIARDKATNVLQRTCDVSQIRATYHPFSADMSRMFPVPGQWRQLLRDNKPYVIFWPDNVPVTRELVPTGYAWLPQPQETVRTPEPQPTPTAPEPPMFTLDIEDTPTAPNEPIDYAAALAAYRRRMRQEQQERQQYAQQQAQQNVTQPQPGTIGYTIRYRNVGGAWNAVDVATNRGGNDNNGQ